MRGSKAKRIRKEVYGDLCSKASERKYFVNNLGQIVSDGLRRRYQKMKGR